MRGGGYGFSVTVCTQQRALNLGLEQLGFLLRLRIGTRLAQIQPRFGPDQHHNLHVSKLTAYK